MKTVQIKTTQHVVIDQELAGLGARIIAFFIDLIIIFALVFILSLIGGFVFSFMSEVYWYLIVSPIIFFYSLISELIMDGQTIGKKAMSLKVVRLNGRAPTPGDYFARWAFRLVDIWFSAGMVAAMLISSTHKGQRLGDIVGKTTVIKARPFERVRLNDVLKIYSLDNYDPKYPGVTSFSEEEMLLAKTTIERNQRFKNKSHREAVDDLSMKMASQMKLQQIPKDRVNFLRTLIKDYIVLTR